MTKFKYKCHEVYTDKSELRQKTHTVDDAIMSLRLPVCVFVSTTTQWISSLVVGLWEFQFGSYRSILPFLYIYHKQSQLYARR